MPDGSAPAAPTPVLCALGGCGVWFVPSRPTQRYHSDGCRWRAHQRLVEETPEGKAAAKRRSAECVERHHAWHCWRSRLRRDGLDTPERLAVLDGLRGRGRVAPDEVRSLLAAAGCPVPVPSARRPPVRVAAPREAATAPVAPAVEAPAPLPPPAPPPPAEASEGRWARPSPDAPRLLPCAVLDLATVSEVSAEGRRGRSPVRHLHAAITAMHDLPHLRQRPQWRLVPESHRAFRVVWHRAEDAERLRATHHDVRLGKRAELMRWGATLSRPRSPAPLAAGVYRVRLDVGRADLVAIDAEREYDPAFDAVSIARNDHTEPTTMPGRQGMQRMASRLLDLAGVEHGHGVEVGEVECMTREVSVRLGGHVQRGDEAGVVIAFDGRITVICNAVAAWALQLARVYGFGGLTAFGLGTVSVSVEKIG